jgi:hypothetical protein
MLSLFKLGALISAMSLAVSMSVGCGSSSSEPASTVVVVAPVQSAQLPVAIQASAVDAATQQPVGFSVSDPITLVVYGADASRLVDADGKTVYDSVGKFAGPFTSSTGLFALYVQPGTPAPASMVFRLVANAKNYVTSSKEVTINSGDLKTDGTTTQFETVISLISQAAPPPAVVLASQPVTLTAGKTGATALAVTTPVASGTDGSGNTVTLGVATVQIPAATTAFSDAARTVPMPAGTTTVVVSYNNNTDGASLAVFPGGFSTRETTAGATITTANPGTMISGGLASIELITTLANGTQVKAKTFDKPISLSISIPKATVNPETNKPVAPGEVIPIWSYDTVTGEWSAMRLNNGTLITGTVGSLDATGSVYTVNFVTDHLSYFNLDWFAWSSSVPGGNTIGQCNTAPITITGANGNRLYLEAVRIGGGWSHPWWLDANAARPAQERYNITYAPRGLPMQINAYMQQTNGANNANFVGSVRVADVCAGVNLDVTAGVNAKTPPVYANVPFLVRAQCTNDLTKFTNLNNSQIAVSSARTSVQYGNTDSAGTATLAGQIVGNTYTLRVATNRGDNFTGKTPTTYTVVQGTNPQQIVNIPVACTTRTVTGAG